MSLSDVAIALETGLNAISPSIDTAWENIDYDPVVGTPYQRVYFMPADPDNSEVGGDIYRQDGIFQVNLFYPLKTGPSESTARAQLIRTTFKRGSTFSKNGINANIDATPKIKHGRVDNGWWMVPVEINFFAHLTT